MDEVNVRFDSERQSILISSLDLAAHVNPLIDIRYETLAKMTFSEASQFVGERLLLLNPELREKFSKYLHGE